MIELICPWCHRYLVKDQYGDNRFNCFCFDPEASLCKDLYNRYSKCSVDCFTNIEPINNEFILSSFNINMKGSSIKCYYDNNYIGYNNSSFDGFPTWSIYIEHENNFDEVLHRQTGSLTLAEAASILIRYDKLKIFI